MKKIILIFTLFVNIYVYSQKALPKSVSDDFTYSVFENYKYQNTLVVEYRFELIANRHLKGSRKLPFFSPARQA